MLDERKILEIIDRSKIEKWPFPKICEKLAFAGVNTYEVDLKANHIIFEGGFQKIIQNYVLKRPLAISSYFDSAAIKKTIAEHQQNGTTYANFLAGVAQAGVFKYQVDIQNRQITYMGIQIENKYVEEIPVSEAIYS